MPGGHVPVRQRIRFLVVRFGGPSQSDFPIFLFDFVLKTIFQLWIQVFLGFGFVQAGVLQQVDVAVPSTGRLFACPGFTIGLTLLRARPSAAPHLADGARQV